MPEFKLPDLGEGLQEAEVIEWRVSEGQKVKVDQLVVLVETAKAIVELPSPVNGTIQQLVAKVGESVAVGESLFVYQHESHTLPSSESRNANNRSARQAVESVSVVGELASVEGSNENLYEAFSLQSDLEESQSALMANKRGKIEATICAPPGLVLFAHKLGLSDLLPAHEYGELSHSDLLKIYQQKLSEQKGEGKPTFDSGGRNRDEKIKLSGARKVMAQSMTKSHQHIPSVTLFDDANITHWKKGEDITLRLIKAIVSAAHQVPLLNAWFDEENLSIQMFEDIHLGVAVNGKEGLFVPVIRKIQTLDEHRIRVIMNKMIQGVNDRTIKAQRLMGATISLSNFGTLSGRYATPIIVPPQVSIVGIGKIRSEPVADGNAVIVGKVMPISLSFDHRAASGADAAAFMQALISSIEE
jgi:pyruvate dehydrogenase E2 component (dihydrolipoamide acetyltransferase)